MKKKNLMFWTHRLLHVTPLQSIPDLVLVVAVERVQIEPGHKTTHLI